MMECRVCKNGQVKMFIDFGQQPVTSRYLKKEDQPENLYKLSMGQCQICGIVQLIDSIPIEEIIPIYDWISYNEAEDHLDRAINNMITTCELKTDAKIRCISYKDFSSLERIKSYGFNDVKPYDFSIYGDNIEVAMTQDVISNRTLENIIQNQEKADLLIARHVLEHSYQPKLFLKGIKNLLANDGYVVFEIPDCSKQFSSLDYTALWEDHILYLTEECLKKTLILNDFDIVDLKIFDYESENAIFVIATPSKIIKHSTPSLNNSLMDLIETYKNSFNLQKLDIQNKLKELKKHGPIVIFGAGHLATSFISILELKEYISFIVDDSENKNGLFLPFSKLPIRDSQALEKYGVKYCLSSLSPESEKNVLKKNSYLSNSNITFGSIFSGRENFLINL